jgi:hypothetical protein
VRKGRIVVHPRSSDLEIMADVEAAMDRMTARAHAILDHGNDEENEGATQGAGPHLVKLADERRP